jgi:hypothetical protein
VEIDREPNNGDEADRASYFIESVVDDHVKEAMRRAAEIPIGEAGECQGCGDYFTRLVDDLCGRCRDKFAKYYAP